MKEMMNDANDLAQTFQFLIGTVLPKEVKEAYKSASVSIPYRYGITR